MVFLVQGHCLVGVVVFNAVGSFSLDLMVELIVLMLNIAHQPLTTMMLDIIVVVLVVPVESVKASMLIETALNLPTVVLCFSIVLIVVWCRSVLTVVEDVLCLGEVGLEKRKLVASLDVFSS